MFVEMDFTPFISPHSTTWFRFAKYEILEHENDMIHIVPAKNAKMITYSPLNMYPEIMKAAIETANKIPRDAFVYYQGISTLLPGDFRGSDNMDDFMEDVKHIEKNKNTVIDALLSFVNRYGLLGIYPIFMRYGFQEIKRRFKTSEAYLYYFFPTIFTNEALKEPSKLNDDIYHTLLYFSNAQVKDNPLDLFSDNVRFTQWYTPEEFEINGNKVDSGPHTTDINLNLSVVKQFYSEPIDLLVSAFRYINTFYRIWLEYKEGKHLPHDEYRDSEPFIDCFDNNRIQMRGHINDIFSWEERLRYFEVNGISSKLKINIKNEFELETCFESLFDVVCYMLLQGITTKNQHQKIRNCEREGCDKIIPFDKSPKARYCSDSCKNIVSAKLWRDNVKKAKELFTSGKTLEEISQILHANINQVKNWLKEHSCNEV